MKGGEGCAEFMEYRGRGQQQQEQQGGAPSLGEDRQQQQQSGVQQSGVQQSGVPSLANIAADLVASHGAVAAIPGISNSAKAALQDAWEKYKMIVHMCEQEEMSNYENKH